MTAPTTTAAGGNSPAAPGPRLLDWRHAKISTPARRCVLCGRFALLRDPDTDEPKHKVCAERAIQEAQS